HNSDGVSQFSAELISNKPVQALPNPTNSQTNNMSAAPAGYPPQRPVMSQPGSSQLALKSGEGEISLKPASSESNKPQEDTIYIDRDGNLHQKQA
ncbi:MAG: hypothetical protein ACREGF_05890, partial [Candidatus Saccharimonadales bacterium]